VPYLAGVPTPQDYGAVGDGVHDDTAAVQTLLSAVAAGGGGIAFFPPGSYAVTPVSSTSAALTLNNGTTGFNGVRVVGSSSGASHLVRLAPGPILSMSGPATDTSGATHCKYCSLENLYLDGAMLTGTLLQTYYADNLRFETVHFFNSYDIVQDTAEFWDSRYYNCQWENSGSTTFGTFAPNVLLRNSAASSGFGFSTDSVNGIHFVGCRWEAFRTGAVSIIQGTSNTNNENGIYLVDCKMESSNVNGGVHLSVDSAARGVDVVNLYCYSGGFEAGNSTAQDVITWGPAAGSLSNVFISNRAATSTIANGVTLNGASSSESAVLRNVVGIYNTSPTGAHINFGTLAGSVDITNCNSNAGTQFGGSIPTKYAAGQPLNQVSGAVADSSFTSTPLDGTAGLDILNHRLYLRANSGTWSFIPVKTVSSAVTSATTVANTTTLSTLQSANVPANDPQTASVYTVQGHGVFSTTGTPTLAFGLYWGGTAGTLLAQIPAITTPSGASNFAFSYEAIVTFRTGTTCVAVLKLFLDTSGTTDAASTYVVSPSTASTVTTSSTQALAVGVTWGTASASNTVTIEGGYTEKIR
jgi:hypothetical protein